MFFWSAGTPPPPSPPLPPLTAFKVRTGQSGRPPARMPPEPALRTLNPPVLSQLYQGFNQGGPHPSLGRLIVFFNFDETIGKVSLRFSRRVFFTKPIKSTPVHHPSLFYPPSLLQSCCQLAFNPTNYFQIPTMSIPHQLRAHQIDSIRLDKTPCQLGQHNSSWLKQNDAKVGTFIGWIWKKSQQRERDYKQNPWMNLILVCVNEEE